MLSQKHETMHTIEKGILMKLTLFLFSICVLLCSCGGDPDERPEEKVSCHESGPYYVADYFETDPFHEDTISIVAFEGPDDILNITIRTNDTTDEIGIQDYIRVYFDVDRVLDQDEGDRVAVSISPGYPEVCFGTGVSMLDKIDRCDLPVDDFSIVSNFGVSDAPFDYPHVSWELTINMRGLITECDVNFEIEVVEDGLSTYYPSPIAPEPPYILFDAVFGYRTSN